MVVRRFRRKDLNLFLTLCKEFYSAKATLKPYREEMARKTFHRVIAGHENLWGYLLEDDTKKVIGYSLVTSYWCNEEGGNVLIMDELYIDAQDQHHGYATQYIEWLNKEFKNKATSITLEVLTTNVSAQHLYVKTGFVPDGFTTYTKEIES